MKASGIINGATLNQLVGQNRSQTSQLTPQQTKESAQNRFDRLKSLVYSEAFANNICSAFNSYSGDMRQKGVDVNLATRYIQENLPRLGENVGTVQNSVPPPNRPNEHFTFYWADLLVDFSYTRASI